MQVLSTDVLIDIECDCRSLLSYSCEFQQCPLAWFTQCPMTELNPLTQASLMLLHTLQQFERVYQVAGQLSASFVHLPRKAIRLCCTQVMVAVSCYWVQMLPQLAALESRHWYCMQRISNRGCTLLGTLLGCNNIGDADSLASLHVVWATHMKHRDVFARTQDCCQPSFCTNIQQYW